MKSFVLFLDKTCNKSLFCFCNIIFKDRLCRIPSVMSVRNLLIVAYIFICMVSRIVMQGCGALQKMVAQVPNMPSVCF